MGALNSYRIRKLIKVTRTLLATDSWSRRAIGLVHDFPNEIHQKADGIYLSKLSLTVGRGSFEFILASYNHLRNLADRLGASFEIKGDQVLGHIQGVTLQLTTAEESFIASEVFLAGSYRFQANGPFVVVDVGMNVGIAALSFAARKDVSRVYAFEPFAETFEQARRNLGLNPQLEPKITVHQFGLGDADQKLTVDYNYTNKGQVGIHGTSMIATPLEATTKAEIVLKEASSVLRPICLSHANESLVLKVDCEGAEYQILRNLRDSGVLNLFRIVCIEWHEKGVESLNDYLSSCGFSTFSSESPGKRVGMIYAVR